MNCLPSRSRAEKAASYEQIYTTTLRLNLADEDDRRAYEHLQRMDKKQYRSYTARRLLPPSMTILNGRHGLNVTHIWKPVKRRMLFFGV
jgi:hypothetical protein